MQVRIGLANRKTMTTDDRRPRVLLIEGDVDLRLALAIRLRASGYDVEALADLVGARSRAAAWRPDVVLFDLDLDRARARERLLAIRQLRTAAETAQVPVVVLTGGSGRLLGLDAVRAGATAFLPRLADHDQLTALLARVLAGEVPVLDMLDGPDGGERWVM